MSIPQVRAALSSEQQLVTELKSTATANAEAAQKKLDLERAEKEAAQRA